MSATPPGSNRTQKEKLFDQFVDILVEMTKPGEDGKPPNPGAAMANVVRQFIKDQNLSGDDDKHEGLKTLKQQSHALPFEEKPHEGDLR